MRYLGVQKASNSFGMRFWLSIASIPQALYGLPESDPYSYTTYPSIEDALEKNRNAKYIQKFVVEKYIPQMISLPSGANNEYLYNVDLVDRKVTLIFVLFVQYLFFKQDLVLTFCHLDSP